MKNILIIDDSETMRFIIKKMITMSHYDIDKLYEASNGHEALEIIHQHHINLILSDINMPEMDGIEMARQLKGNESYKHIPLVFITTDATYNRMYEANKLGIYEFIRKPFEMDSIVSLLERMV